MRKRLRPRDGYDSDEPIKRLSLNLKESLHTRFKTACSAANRKMATELQEFVERRTQELEEEAGLSGSGWARQIAERHPGLSARDCVHLAVMEAHRVSRILSFDESFSEISGVTRLP